jgi:phenylacetate-CoA ligase
MAGAFPHRSAIASHQLGQLRALASALLPANPFYKLKLSGAGVTGDLASLEEFSRRVPFTTKTELVEDQRRHPPYGTNLTFPLARYTRCHQTSGTSGAPLRWLDTPESWSWMLDNWAEVFRAAEVTRADHVFFAFSFGPFLGFWTAFESALRLGCRCLPGGGMNSLVRLRVILEHEITVLCCTPTYAIHLAEVAAQEKINLAASKVKTIIVAGEPGGSIPATRQRLAQLWPGARICDHHGMTEIGPVTLECPVRPGVLHVLESAYFPEIINPQTGQPAAPGEAGELVLTNLGRTGSPLLRYRTGDLVQPQTLDPKLATLPCPCGRFDLALEGGIRGRTDDMVVVRGVNFFPGAVEEIIRQTGGVAEFRVRVAHVRALAELSVEIEPLPDCADPRALARRLESAFDNAFALRVPVTPVAPGSLPRFEMKARRWVKD